VYCICIFNNKLDLNQGTSFYYNKYKNLGIDDVAHINVRPISLGGSFEGHVWERGQLTSPDVHPEHVAGLGSDDADDIFVPARDVALQVRVDPVDEDSSS